jgi:hypothetical protein
MTVVDRPTISVQFFGWFHAHGFANKWKKPSIYRHFCTRPRRTRRSARPVGFCVAEAIRLLLGLIFFVPGFDETLRVNGTGRLVTDAALLTPLEAQGKVPATGLLVSITEVFFHCGKALIRSKLWDPSRHVARDSFPSLGRIIAEQTAVMSAESAEQYVATSYRERLY